MQTNFRVASLTLTVLVAAPVLAGLGSRVSKSSWALQGEASGFAIRNQIVGVFEGPKLWTGNSPSNPDCTLYWGVYQHKGDEGWTIPWSTDLEELGYGSSSFNMDFNSATFEFGAGTFARVTARIREDWHYQQWHDEALGTSRRDGSVDSYDGWLVEFLE